MRKNPNNDQQEDAYTDEKFLAGCFRSGRASLAFGLNKNPQEIEGMNDHTGNADHQEDQPTRLAAGYTCPYQASHWEEREQRDSEQVEQTKKEAGSQEGSSIE